MFQSPTTGQGGRGTGRGGGGVAKLMISNLDYGVSTDDIKVRKVASLHRHAMGDML